MRALAVAVLVIGVIVCGSTLLVAAVAPASRPARAAAGILPLPAVHAAVAAEALGRRPQDLILARQASNAALRAAPRQAELHLQRAYIETLAGGRLNERAREAFSAAYRLAPLDHRLARWRIPFALDQWQALAPADRRQVLAETEVLWTSIAERRWLRSLPASVRNPSGRLAIQLQVERLKSESRAARGREGAAGCCGAKLAKVELNTGSRAGMGRQSLMFVE